MTQALPGQQQDLGTERSASLARPIASFDDLLHAYESKLGIYDETARQLLRLRLLDVFRRSVPILQVLYPGHNAHGLTLQFVERALAAAADRKPELLMLDVDAIANPEWFQSHEMIGYVAYAEQFGPTISDVAKRLDYLGELGVRYFHLMKVLASRDAPNDGGFAVSDYLQIDPALGTMDELEALADALRDRKIALCLDVVMNHTAAEHRNIATTTFCFRIGSSPMRTKRRCRKCFRKLPRAISPGIRNSSHGYGRRSTPINGI
jgi:Alpha amylase, catalytic domain